MERVVCTSRDVQRCLVASIVCIGLLAGCATDPVVEGGQAAAAAQSASEDGPVIVDHRPATDRLGSVHSKWMGSCDVGISTIEEADAGRTYLAFLHDDLASLPGDPWSGHQIIVSHYAAYENGKRQLKARAYTSAVGGGILGGLISNALAGSTKDGESCAPGEIHGGWYAADEATSNVPPVVVEIEATVDGRPVKIHSVYSPAKPVGFKPKTEAERAGLVAAIKKADLAFASVLGGHAAQYFAQSPATTQASAPAGGGPVAPIALASANPDILSLAQKAASQIGCGQVQATGRTTFAAQCGSYAVAIDCDIGQCRPTHTIGTASAQ